MNMFHLFRVASIVVLSAMVAGLSACQQETKEAQPPAPPSPTYTGPEFLHTTIASVTMVIGYQPQLVSGYGLVVGLDGTGSPDCPPQLRQWLLNEMSRKGIGRGSAGAPPISPTQMLASDRTAVVLVEGVIPPGAVGGTSFDVQVSALPQTQTTSLQGGRLYTTDLRVGGKYIGRSASRPLAEGRGDLFINPFVSDSGGRGDPEPRPTDPHVGRVIGGGMVLDDATLALQLNQPSFTRSRQIADRINGRFPPMPGDNAPLAVAKNDQLIQLNVLKRFRADPRHMLELINGLYLNPTDRFNRQRAAELIDTLAEPGNQQHATQIALVWEGMGKQVLPILQDAYRHENIMVRLTALEAGARLGDIRAEEPLTEIALGRTAGASDRGTALLGQLLSQHPNNFRIAVTLRNLLDDDDALVRLAAYDGLERIDDPAIIRRSFDDRFDMSLVNASKPMIYITRSLRPRIVIFNQMLAFEQPMLFTHDDNQLMVNYEQGADQASVYYRPNGQTRGTTRPIAPAVANLVVLLGRRPTASDPSPGYNMTYSQIVRILHRMTRESHVDAPMVLEPSNLVQRISRYRLDELATERPETGDANRPSQPESE